MGITIRCKKTGRSCDLGTGGFLRFRSKVAALHNEEFGNHYAKLASSEAMLLRGSARKAWYDEFDKKTEELIEAKKAHVKVVDFCMQSDCEGRIRYGACKVIFKSIEDYDDNICYGYAGRPDCAMFSDLKAIIRECVETKSDLIWD